MKFKMIIIKIWAKCWMLFSNIFPFRKFAPFMAALFYPPYYGKTDLAWYHPKGYISHSAKIYHSKLIRKGNSFVDDNVVVYEGRDSGSVVLGKQSHLFRDIIIQTGLTGSVEIGENTFIQPRCIFSAFSGSIIIGDNVQIAPACGFYPYNHSFSPDDLIRHQPLYSKGGIIVEDDVWIGYGVIVLDGVRIGKGAVIGAGSIVTTDIPDMSIAVGSPAKVVNSRLNIK